MPYICIRHDWENNRLTSSSEAISIACILLLGHRIPGILDKLDSLPVGY